jgi:hypothetical protein
LPEPLPTPEEARELLIRFIAGYEDRPIPGRHDQTPEGIWDALQGERENPSMLDDAQAIRELAEISGDLDTPIYDLIGDR